MFFQKQDLHLLCARGENNAGHFLIILAEGAIALSVTLSGGALFASLLVDAIEKNNIEK